MSKKTINRTDCYIGESGDIFLLFDGEYLPFKNLDEALKVTEGRLSYLINEAICFFERLNRPKRRIKIIKQEFKTLGDEFGENYSLSVKLEKNKDKFFELLKEIENLKIFYKREGTRQKILKKMVEIRNKLISIFTQLQKLEKIKNTSREIIKTFKDNLNFCESYLTSFISSERDLDPYSIEKIEEKLSLCKIKVDNFNPVAPYRETFHRLYQVLCLENNFGELTAKLKAKELYRRVKEAKTILSENYSFA